MKPLVDIDLKVTSVKQNGWGVLVTGAFLDRSAHYDNLILRYIEFMASSGSGQPLVGETLRLTITRGDNE